MSYLLSLLIGTAVGVAYALLGIRSPAPPLVALLGLLGMVLGETGTNVVKHRYLAGSPTATATLLAIPAACGFCPSTSPTKRAQRR